MNQPLLYSPFRLFIWLQEKGKGLCISQCAQKGSYTGPEPVRHYSKCCMFCIQLSFFPSIFSLYVSLQILLVFNDGYQQEARTDNTLNQDLPCDKVTGNRFML